MNKTILWWKFLCITALINIGIWLGATWVHSDMQNVSIAHLLLSGIYVLVCAFRSFYPRIDLERYCLHDTPFSSVVLGRSCATIAEICFSIQCALILFELGTLLESPVITTIAYSVVPIIVLAQAFCWYATLTLNHFWHGMEEAAWVVMVSLAGGCFLVGAFELTGAIQLLMAVGVVSCVGSGYIMLAVDIPMYLSRTQENQNQGHAYLSVTDGIRDALRRRIPTHDWHIWKNEVVWITSYFTFGVWLSIGMVFVDFSA